MDINKVITFFDCNCTVGVSGVRYCGVSYDTGDMLVKMRRYGIDKALVYHIASRECDAATGNDLLDADLRANDVRADDARVNDLLDADLLADDVRVNDLNENRTSSRNTEEDGLTDDPALFGVWVVMPHHTREFCDPDTLDGLLTEKKIKAVRIFPKNGNYSVAKWNCGGLFAMLEKRGSPLFADADQLDIAEIHGILAEFPRLNLVLTGLGYRMDRNLFALMEKFPRLYLETSGYKGNNGIEEVCGRFGAGRLVFGSGMPVKSGGSAVSMIRYARIGEAEKRMIASENLLGLLEGGA